MTPHRTRSDVVKNSTAAGRKFLVAINVYLGSTVLLFLFGPWHWPLSNTPTLVFFLIAAQVSFTIGFFGSWRRRRRIGCRWSSVPIDMIEKIVVAGAIVSFLLVVPTSLARTGKLLPDIGSGLGDLGQGYITSRLIRTSGGEYLAMVFAPLRVFLLPLLVFYWHDVSRRTRFLGSMAVVVNGLVFVAIGTNRYFFSTLIVTLTLLFARSVWEPARQGAHGGGVWRRWTIILSAFGMVILVFGFFTATQFGRQGGGTLGLWDRHSYAWADATRLGFDRLPHPYDQGAVRLAGYLTQGYYGLGLAIEEPFVPTYGVGNSLFLLRNTQRLPGFSSYPEPYPVRVSRSSDWPYRSKWSSLYPWLASDVSFPGVLLLMAGLGLAMGSAWNDAVGEGNPFGVAALALFVLVIAYIPANNQMMQSGEELIGSVAVVFLWLWSRHSSLPRQERRPVSRFPENRSRPSL